MTKIKKISALVLACLMACVCIVLNGCGESSSSSSSSSSSKASSSSSSTSTSDEGEYKSSYTAVIDVKDYGTIKVDLYEELAPITVENFIKLANEGFYDGLTFHRIIDGFMIQGGDPNADGTGGSDETIKGEFNANNVMNNLSHTRGVISMARSNDYDSASSQFFIVQSDSTHLDGQYAAFGMVTEGMDIVDKICEDTPVTDSNGTVEKANQPVINSITIEEK